MVASLFLKVDKEKYGDYVKNMYINIAKEMGDVPIEVAKASCEKYLHPTPKSPLHSSCIALSEKSTGTNASSESQPFIPPSAFI